MDEKDIRDIEMKALLDLQQFLDDNPHLMPVQAELNRRLAQAGEHPLARIAVIAEMMEWTLAECPFEEFQIIAQKWGNISRSLEELAKYEDIGITKKVH